MPTRRTSTWQDDQRKDYINPKGLKERNCLKQLQTDNLPTNDVENINSTNKWRDLLLTIKPQIVPWRTESLVQKIIDQHIVNESKTRRKNLAMAWIDHKKAYDIFPQSLIIY